MRVFLLLAAAAAMATLVACAAPGQSQLFPGSAFFPGRDLVPGKSTAAEVEAVLGKPADKQPLTGGDDVWFYPGRTDPRFMYAVQMSPEGVVRKVDQRLEDRNVRVLQPERTTMQGARALLGPPLQTARATGATRDVWSYKLYDEMGSKMVLDLSFSSDGVLRETNYRRDPLEISGAN